MRFVLLRFNGMKPVWVFVLCALGVAIFLAVAVSPFASSAPDGLERVAADKGFLAKGEGTRVWRWSPIRDYTIPGVSSASMGTAAAGALGTLAAFGVGLLAAKALRGRKTHERGE